MPYVTQQKLALTGLIQHAERPLTPAEICRTGRHEIPSLGIATVYRTLKQLMKAGQVRVVDIPGAAPHYECTARQHHHFFVCQQCRHLYNLEGCVPGVGALVPKGFSVSRHEIVLYGACRDCRATPRPAAKPRKGAPAHGDR